MAKSDGTQSTGRYSAGGLIAAGMIGAAAGVVAAAMSNPANRKKVGEFLGQTKAKALDLKDKALQATEELKKTTDGMSQTDNNSAGKPKSKGTDKKTS